MSQLNTTSLSKLSAQTASNALFSADAVRLIEQYVIEQHGIPGFELMQRAAASAFRQLVRQWPEATPVLVLCGGGNNGGDGYLIAAAAHRHGLHVRCIACKDPADLKGDAAGAYQKAKADGVKIDRWEALAENDRNEALISAGLVVDAMLGTGVMGAPREPYKSAITACNGLTCPVMAVDIPSGLDATTGAVSGEALKASLTVTFIAQKSGLFLAQGPELAGQVIFEDLDLDIGRLDHGQVPVAQRFSWATVSSDIPVRPVTAHKGHFGHVLVIAGDSGYGGAGLLAAEAASRSGAGLVSLATRPDYVAPALTRCPSLMVRGLDHGSEVAALIEAADTVVCGPGIGQSAWGQQMLQQVVLSGKMRVLDADALNLMAQQASAIASSHVLTPHPGEAARLLDCTVAEVETDRLAAADRLQKKFGGVVLLKGAGTVIADGENGPWVLDGGNPGMATGGMGDALSGIIGALLGQGLAPCKASCMAAALHLAAANLASERLGYMALLPQDVIEAMAGLLATAEKPGKREAG